MYLKVNTATSRSGLVAHSRDIRGDLDMMVALVCMMGLNDHTWRSRRGRGRSLS